MIGKNTQIEAQQAMHGQAAAVGLIVALLLAALFVTGSITGAFAAPKMFRLTTADKVGHLNVSLNKSRAIRVDKTFAEVQIGSSEIADVMPLTNRSFYLLGKKPGTTNISLYDNARRLLGVFDVEVSFDIGSVRRNIAQNVRGAKIKVSSLNGKIMLSGTAPNAPAVARAVMIAQQYAPNAVTNALTVGSPQQVMLEVRFIEANRTAGRGLGINFNGQGKGHSVATGNGLLTPSAPFGTVVANLLSGGFNADIIIRALEEKGLARRLAEPNLTTLSGETASFLAGGEFPFPVGADNGEVRIEFKKFGVGLKFTPTVLAGGLINIQIEPEVSQLDNTNTIRISSFEIPSLIVRRAQTTVELRDGQSFAIAGLLQSNHSKNRNQLPWLGSVPVLGALFSSSQYEKNETDLVIIVTPRLVKPVAPGQRLASPLERRVPGNDVDFFLKGRMDYSKKALQLFERGDGHKHYGHILKTRPVGPPVPAATLIRHRPSRDLRVVKANAVARHQNFGIDAHVLD